LFILLFFLISSNSDTLYYYADTVIYDQKDGKITLIGNVSLFQDEDTLNADTVFYFIKEKKVLALGHPLLTEGNQKIKGDSIFYYIEKSFGTITNGKTQVEKGWFYGKYTRLIEKNTLKVQDGYFTTCNLDPPHYWFYSPKMRVELNNMVIASPVILLVQDIPLFIAPFWFFPVKKGRRSGFMVPKFGQSNMEGHYIKKVAYYLVMGDNADLTIGADWIEKRGILINEETRWNILFMHSKGNFNGRWIKEVSGNKRWSLNLQNGGVLPFNILFSAFSNMQSDENFQQNYNEDVKRKLVKDVESYINLKRNIFSGQISTVWQIKKDFETNTVTKKQPAANLTFPSINPFGFNISSSGFYLRDENRNNGGNFLFNLNRGLSILYYLHSNLSFSQTTYFLPSSYGGFVYPTTKNISVGLNTHIYGTSLFGFLMFEKFRHTISPSVSFNFSPVESLPDYIKVGGITPSKGGARSLNIGIGNLFQGKIGKNTINLAQMNIGTGYDFNQHRFPSVSISSNAWLGKYAELRLTTSYNTLTHKWSSLDLTASGAYTWKYYLRQNSITARYHKIFGDTITANTDQINISTNLWLTKNWRFTYGFNFDIYKGIITDKNLSVYRDLHCWELTVEWGEFGNDWRYNIKLGLKAIPEVRIERGVMGMFLGE